MLHSYVKVYVHFVWSTKNREPFLGDEVRPKVQNHVLIYAQTKNISIDTIGIQKEHIHLLVSMRSNQNIDDVAKLLKGESSHWINSENLIKPKFSWQRGYGAFSISPSHLDAVRTYINNQDEHHRNKSYSEEVADLLTKYGYDKNEINKGEEDKFRFLQSSIH
jgi:REP element-mobilizing transposase RayT